jgi:NAD(P)-dependent dehydrogenase (short-subunit alcohol dehydrogenase family)
VAELRGGVGFVTGAASGIGRATALAAAKAGASGLVIADLNADGLDETATLIDDGTRVVTAPVDLVDEDAMAAAVGLASGLGQLTFAINAAGIVAAPVPVAETELAGWQRIIDVNLTGTMISMKHELAALGDGGALVNVVASIGAVAAIPGLGAYAASKAGVAMLTKVAALEQGSAGIRVNAVAPGGTDTPMNAYLDDETKAAMAQMHALGRFAAAEEVAAAAVWLASSEASFVTGAVLPVDGGFATAIAGS